MGKITKYFTWLLVQSILIFAICGVVVVNLQSFYASKLDAIKLSGKLVGDMINYCHIYIDKLDAMTISDIKNYEKHRLELEIKLLEELRKVMY